jgi:hypothetical protein
MTTRSLFREKATPFAGRPPKLSKLRKRLSMATGYRCILAAVALLALLLASAENGRAQVMPHAGLDGSNAKTDLGIAGFLTAVALVPVGIYFARGTGTP